MHNFGLTWVHIEHIILLRYGVCCIICRICIFDGKWNVLLRVNSYGEYEIITFNILWADTYVQTRNTNQIMYRFTFKNICVIFIDELSQMTGLHKNWCLLDLFAFKFQVNYACYTNYHWYHLVFISKTLFLPLFNSTYEHDLFQFDPTHNCIWVIFPCCSNKRERGICCFWVLNFT